MPRFELTAKSDLYRADGTHIKKGDVVNLFIPMQGITPYNLFNNQRCAEQIIRQMQFHGINVKPGDAHLLSRGMWNVKMV